VGTLLTLSEVECKERGYSKSTKRKRFNEAGVQKGEKRSFHRGGRAKRSREEDTRLSCCFGLGRKKNRNTNVLFKTAKGGQEKARGHFNTEGKTPNAGGVRGEGLRGPRCKKFRGSRHTRSQGHAGRTEV